MSGWECPRCGETRSATSRCHCAGVGRCVWCGMLIEGYPRCDCPDGPEDDEGDDAAYRTLPDYDADPPEPYTPEPDIEALEREEEGR